LLKPWRRGFRTIAAAWREYDICTQMVTGLRNQTIFVEEVGRQITQKIREIIPPKIWRVF
jgi:hypothetical protein